MLLSHGAAHEEQEQGKAKFVHSWWKQWNYRLFIRGIDDDGNVANFVETEQILQLHHIACSYVQVMSLPFKSISDRLLSSDSRVSAVLLVPIAQRSL